MELVIQYQRDGNFFGVDTQKDDIVHVVDENNDLIADAVYINGEAVPELFNTQLTPYFRSAARFYEESGQLVATDAFAKATFYGDEILLSSICLGEIPPYESLANPDLCSPYINFATENAERISIKSDYPIKQIDAPDDTLISNLNLSITPTAVDERFRNDQGRAQNRVTIILNVGVTVGMLNDLLKKENLSLASADFSAGMGSITLEATKNLSDTDIQDISNRWQNIILLTSR